MPSSFPHALFHPEGDADVQAVEHRGRSRRGSTAACAAGCDIGRAVLERPFAEMAKHEFVSLTTFCRNGGSRGDAGVDRGGRRHFGGDDASGQREGQAAAPRSPGRAARWCWRRWPYCCPEPPSRSYVDPQFDLLVSPLCQRGVRRHLTTGRATWDRKSSSGPFAGDTG